MEKPNVESLYLKYDLTEAEKQEMGLEMAKAISKNESLNDELKAVKADFKARIEAEELNIKTLARKVGDGFEMRHIDCTIERDYDFKEIRWYRQDTGELAKSRKMTADDLQMEIPN